VITEKDHPFKPVREKHNFQVIYNLAKKVGIKFPEVVAAQFGVESVYGSKITGTNNYLGIKAKPEDIKSGNFTEVDTLEEVDGKKIKVKAKFKNFKSIEEMLLDYKKHHNDDFFNGFSTRKGTVNVDTAKEAIIRLKENGYATDSDYVKLVTDVLNDAIRNKLF
jgi:flagellum-specific peptidoglycan hydrolase FlgJ